MAMAMAMAMLTTTARVTTTARIDYHLLLESNEIIAAIIYISFFYSMKM
jgi:hypothetical protein